MINLCLLICLASASASECVPGWVPHSIAEAWKKYTTAEKSDETKKDCSTCHGCAVKRLFGCSWLKKSDKAKEVVTPEVEKEVLQKIEATSNKFNQLHEYAKKYSSHAAIRNALMQKSVNASSDEPINDEQQELIHKLIKNVDATCDQQAIIQWIIAVEKEIKKIKKLPFNIKFYSEYKNWSNQMMQEMLGEWRSFGFRDALKNKGLIKEVIRSAALQGQKFIFDDLSDEDRNLFIKSMTHEDVIYFCLYNAHKHGSNPEFDAVVKKIMEHEFLRNPNIKKLLDANVKLSGDISRAILSSNWQAVLKYKLDLYNNKIWRFKTWRFSLTPLPMDYFITDCIKNDKIEWIEYIFKDGKFFHKNEVLGLQPYLSFKGFRLLVNYFASNAQKVSWDLYNNLRIHKEVRAIAFKRLQLLKGDDLLKALSECKDLIAMDQGIMRHVINQVTIEGSANLDKNFRVKLFKLILEVADAQPSHDIAKRITNFYCNNIADLRDADKTKIMHYASYLYPAEKNTFVRAVREYMAKHAGTERALVLTEEESIVLDKLRRVV